LKFPVGEITSYPKNVLKLPNVKVVPSETSKVTYNWFTVFDEPTDPNTASSPLGPATISATKPTFPICLDAIRFTKPKAKPLSLANEVAGATAPLLLALKFVLK